jgi:hypothetical protein
MTAAATPQPATFHRESRHRCPAQRDRCTASEHVRMQASGVARSDRVGHRRTGPCVRARAGMALVQGRRRCGSSLRGFTHRASVRGAAAARRSEDGMVFAVVVRRVFESVGGQRRIQLNRIARTIAGQRSRLELQHRAGTGGRRVGAQQSNERCASGGPQPLDIRLLGCCLGSSVHEGAAFDAFGETATLRIAAGSITSTSPRVGRPRPHGLGARSSQRAKRPPIFDRPSTPMPRRWAWSRCASEIVERVVLGGRDHFEQFTVIRPARDGVRDAWGFDPARPVLHQMKHPVLRTRCGTSPCRHGRAETQ